MGAGRPPIKGSGTIRPRPPELPSSRSPGIGGSLIGGAIKAKDEQRNAADGAFRDNDRSNRRKASPNKPPRGPGREPMATSDVIRHDDRRGPIRGPGRRPEREPIRGRIQDPNDPTRYNEPKLPDREPDNTVRPAPTDPEPFRRPIEDRRPRDPDFRRPRRPRDPDFRRPRDPDFRIPEDRRPIQRPGRDPLRRPIYETNPVEDRRPIQRPGRDPLAELEPTRPGFTPGYGAKIGAPPFMAFTHQFLDNDGDGVDDRNQRGPGIDPFTGKPSIDKGKEPGRPGIMPIPDKFKDPDGNPYKQPGRGPKDLQRKAVEDGMRRGGRKGGRK